MSVEHFPGEQIHVVKELRPFFLKMRISSLNPQSDVLLPIRFFTEDGSFHTGRIYHQFIFFDGDEVQRDASALIPLRCQLCTNTLKQTSA